MTNIVATVNRSPIQARLQVAQTNKDLFVKISKIATCVFLALAAITIPFSISASITFLALSGAASIATYLSNKYIKVPVNPPQPHAQPLAIQNAEPARIAPILDAGALWNELETKTKQHFRSLAPDAFVSDTEARHRFKDVTCPMATAVKVGAQYLHANHVGLDDSLKFIATQAPHVMAVELFWSAVYQSGSLIVDLTSPRDKITPYYPGIDMEGREVINDEQFFELPQFILKIVQKEESLYSYEFTDKATGEKKIIKRFHFKTWPDQGVVSVETLSKLVNDLIKEKGTSTNPTWIHCRAGVGRTGTLITATILKEKIQKKELNLANLDTTLVNLIFALRKQRGPLFVQTREQFELLRNYATHLLTA